MPSRLIQLEASNKALWEEAKAVRAENDRLRALAEAENARGGVARDECVRLRAELAENEMAHAAECEVLAQGLHIAHTDRRKAEAAIARVRDLCRESLGSPSTTVRAWSRDVLRALDGAE